MKTMIRILCAWLLMSAAALAQSSSAPPPINYGNVYNIPRTFGTPHTNCSPIFLSSGGATQGYSCYPPYTLTPGQTVTILNYVGGSTTGVTTNGSPTISSVASFTNITQGMLISAPGSAPGARVADYSVANGTITMSSNAGTGAGSGAVTTTTEAGLINYLYLAGAFPDQPSGQNLLEQIYVDGEVTPSVQFVPYYACNFANLLQFGGPVTGWAGPDVHVDMKSPTQWGCSLYRLISFTKSVVVKVTLPSTATGNATYVTLSVNYETGTTAPLGWGVYQKLHANFAGVWPYLGVAPATPTATLSTSSKQVSNLSSESNLVANMWVSSGSCYPANTTVVSVDDSTHATMSNFPTCNGTETLTISALPQVSPLTLTPILTLSGVGPGVVYHTDTYDGFPAGGVESSFMYETDWHTTPNLIYAGGEGWLDGVWSGNRFPNAEAHAGMMQEPNAVGPAGTALLTGYRHHDLDPVPFSYQVKLMQSCGMSNTGGTPASPCFDGADWWVYAEE